MHDGEPEAEELNRFLGANRIVAVDRQFIQDGANSAWALCVQYLAPGDRPQPPGRRGKIDYREVLSDADFALFARLRALRKTLADQEGVPAYALFTNDQLAEMARRRVVTAAGLKAIQGVGDARVEKHGEAFLAILRDEAPPPTDGDDDAA